jgi:hypothetical protein
LAAQAYAKNCNFIVHIYSNIGLITLSPLQGKASTEAKRGDEKTAALNAASGYEFRREVFASARSGDAASVSGAG